MLQKVANLFHQLKSYHCFKLCISTSPHTPQKMLNKPAVTPVIVLGQSFLCHHLDFLSVIWGHHIFLFYNSYMLQAKILFCFMNYCLMSFSVAICLLKPQIETYCDNTAICENICVQLMVKKCFNSFWFFVFRVENKYGMVNLNEYTSAILNTICLWMLFKHIMIYIVYRGCIVI